MLSASPEERVVHHLLIEHAEHAQDLQIHRQALATGRAVIESYVALQVELGLMTLKPENEAQRD